MTPTPEDENSLPGQGVGTAVEQWRRRLRKRLREQGQSEAPTKAAAEGQLRRPAEPSEDDSGS